MIAPALIAVEMIVIGVSLTSLFSHGGDFKPGSISWALGIAGTLLLLFSFMRDLDAGLRYKPPQPYWYPLLFIGLICYGAGYLIAFHNVKFVDE